MGSVVRPGGPGMHSVEHSSRMSPPTKQNAGCRRDVVVSISVRLLMDVGVLALALWDVVVPSLVILLMDVVVLRWARGDVVVPALDLWGRCCPDPRLWSRGVNRREL